MRLHEFCDRTGVSKKVAKSIFDKRHKKTTYQREFSEADVQWVLDRKLDAYKGKLKQVPNFPFYYVSDTGIVYSYRRGFLEKVAGYYNQGYHYVCLQHNKQHLKIKVARLVGLLYIPNPLNKPVINHKDANKGNDCVTNLEWATIAENTKHAFDIGVARNAKGFEDSQSKPVVHVTLKGEIIAVYESISIAAQQLGLYKTRIGRAAQANTPRFLNDIPMRSQTDTTFIYYTPETQNKLSSVTSISK